MEEYPYVKELISSLHLEGHAGWIVQVFIITLVTAIVSYIVRNLLKRLQIKMARTENLWDDALIRAIRNPARILIWVVGVGFAAQVIYKETGAEIFSGFSAIRDVGVIAVFVWAAVRFIEKFKLSYLQHSAQRKGRVDETTADAVGKILKATVIITGVLVILQTLGFSIEGVLAFGGVGGIAVGFAARDLLANFFGALMIYFDRPFVVGDWIRSPDQEIEGTVEHIGWRQTRIRTFDKRPLYVPNSVFSTIAVENPSRMTHRRINETIGIRYDDIAHMQSITDEVREMLQNHPEIDTSQTLMVQFNAFNASSCDFFIYTFTHTTVWTKFHEIKHEILLKISDIIESHGAEIAFPTRTLHLPEGVQVMDRQPSQAASG